MICQKKSMNWIEYISIMLALYYLSGKTTQYNRCRINDQKHVCTSYIDQCAAVGLSQNERERESYIRVQI